MLVDGDGWIKRGGDCVAASDRSTPVILIDLARGVRDVAFPHGLPRWTLAVSCSPTHSAHSAVCP